MPLEKISVHMVKGHGQTDGLWKNVNVYYGYYETQTWQFSSLKCLIVADSICLMENWIRYQRNFYFSSELVSRERLPRDKAAVSRVVSLRFPLFLSVTHRLGFSRVFDVMHERFCAQYMYLCCHFAGNAKFVTRLQEYIDWFWPR